VTFCAGFRGFWRVAEPTLSCPGRAAALLRCCAEPGPNGRVLRGCMGPGSAAHHLRAALRPGHDAVAWGHTASTPSLRAQRSNPESLSGDSLDCFVARAPRNDGRCGWITLRSFRPTGYTVCATALRDFGALAIANNSDDRPVSAASTRPAMCARRSSLAFLSSRSRPKITLSVAEFER